MWLSQSRLVMGMRLLRCLSDCTFWVNGEFECLSCADTHWYRKCNAPTSLEELTDQHASTWTHVTPVVGNKPGTPPITQAPSMSSVGSVSNLYHHPVSGETGSRVVEASTVQHGPLQVLGRSMIDLQHRMTGLEREPSPVSSLSSPLLSLVVTTSTVAQFPGP